MSTMRKGQENRYLESPYVIMESGASGQAPFVSAGDNVGGYFVFYKKNFLTERSNPSHIERSKEKEVIMDK